MKGEEKPLAAALSSARARLASALTLDAIDARLEAQILVAHALRVDRAWLIAHDRDLLSPHQQQAIAELIEQRASGTPVAQILGEREFYGRAFRVTPAVLIPRADTELLVEAALARMHPRARVLDLGVGSGCIAISLALEAPQASVLAVDASEAALAVARANAERMGASVQFVPSHWFDALAGERFDVIVSNPPYIAKADPHLAHGDLRFEPRDALAAGDDGLDALRHIIAGAPAHLVPGGCLLVEHGWKQGPACRDLFASHGYYDISTLTDLANHERVSLGRR